MHPVTLKAHVSYVSKSREDPHRETYGPAVYTPAARAQDSSAVYAQPALPAHHPPRAQSDPASARCGARPGVIVRMGVGVRIVVVVVCSQVVV
jgi:hypothetical protein